MPFRLVRLAAGDRYEASEPGREARLLPVTGTVRVDAGGRSWTVGGRADVFAGPVASLYLPPDTPYAVVAQDAAELAVCTAPATGAKPSALIPADAVETETRGTGTNIRYVRNGLPDTSDVAESLFVVEVITPGGHWSSYPPHKHDRDAYPEETLLEETYYHRVACHGGFALQRIYTDDRSLDEAVTVENGDVVLVPGGYHPVGAAHGCDLYYLNVMAGPRRAWRFTVDPTFVA